MPYNNCKICSKEFYIKPSHLKLGYGKYCSVKCRAQSQKKGKNVYCEICNKEIWRMPKCLKKSKSGKFFCSKSCQTKWRNKYYSGDKHYFWKGGENVYRKRMLSSDIRLICKKCGVKDIRILVVHHKDRDRKNNGLENLIWLCRNCHHLIHNHNEKIK